jgi:NhaP-type Na+/H+ or K+/H+ antiporter
VLVGLFSVGGILILERFQTQRYTYVLTLGLVFVTYSLSSELGGSGELSVLIFGIMLGNYSVLNAIRRRRFDLENLRNQLGLFQEEISFLMETLFFVFLGLTFLIDPAQVGRNMSVGVIILLTRVEWLHRTSLR